jgi:predicted nucleotidyltransferase
MGKPKTSLSVNDIKDRLAPFFKKEGLQLVLLFGSIAKGSVHGKSDIDLGFLFDEPVDVLTLTNEVTKLLHSDRVDVVDLRRASPLLRFCAAQKGKVLYERSEGLFNQFFSLAFRTYVDTKKLRDAQGEMIRDFLEKEKMV